MASPALPAAIGAASGAFAELKAFIPTQELMDYERAVAHAEAATGQLSDRTEMLRGEVDRLSRASGVLSQTTSVNLIASFRSQTFAIAGARDALKGYLEYIATRFPQTYREINAGVLQFVQSHQTMSYVLSKGKYDAASYNMALREGNLAMLAFQESLLRGQAPVRTLATEMDRLVAAFNRMQASAGGKTGGIAKAAVSGGASTLEGVHTALGGYGDAALQIALAYATYRGARAWQARGKGGLGGGAPVGPTGAVPWREKVAESLGGTAHLIPEGPLWQRDPIWAARRALSSKSFGYKGIGVGGAMLRLGAGAAGIGTHEAGMGNMVEGNYFSGAAGIIGGQAATGYALGGARGAVIGAAFGTLEAATVGLITGFGSLGRAAREAATGAQQMAIAKSAAAFLLGERPGGAGPGTSREGILAELETVSPARQGAVQTALLKALGRQRAALNAGDTQGLANEKENILKLTATGVEMKEKENALRKKLATLSSEEVSLAQQQLQILDLMKAPASARLPLLKKQIDATRADYESQKTILEAARKRGNADEIRQEEVKLNQKKIDLLSSVNYVRRSMSEGFLENALGLQGGASATMPRNLVAAQMQASGFTQGGIQTRTESGKASHRTWNPDTMQWEDTGGNRQTYNQMMRGSFNMFPDEIRPDLSQRAVAAVTKQVGNNTQELLRVLKQVADQLAGSGIVVQVQGD